MHVQCVTCTVFWRALRACLTSILRPRGYTVAGRCKISFELLPLDIRILLARKLRVPPNHQSTLAIFSYLNLSLVHRDEELIFILGPTALYNVLTVSFSNPCSLFPLCSKSRQSFLLDSQAADRLP